MRGDGKTNTVRPELLDGFARQGALTEKLKEMLTEAKAQGRGYLPPFLLLGKDSEERRSIIDLLAEALSARCEHFEHITFPSSESERLINEWFVRVLSEGGRVCAICYLPGHSLADDEQKLFLTKLNSYRKAAEGQEITFVLYGNTDEYLIPPLKEIAACRLDLSAYTPQEAAALARDCLSKPRPELKLCVPDLSVEVGAAEAVAARYIASPEDVRHYSSEIRKMAISLGMTAVTRSLVEGYFLECGIDSLGYGGIQRMILRHLLDAPGQSASVEEISYMTHIIDFVLIDDYLLPLVKKGLIVLRDEVLNITEQGRAHIRAVAASFPNDGWFL